MNRTAATIVRIIPDWYHSMWTINPTEEYQRRHKWFQKKHPRELEATLSNLKRFFEALVQGAKPAQIQGRWIHHEPMGVIALDQRGGEKKVGGKNYGKGLRQTRLYVFPDVQIESLDLIILGDKSTQTEDIAYAKRYIRAIEVSRTAGQHEGVEKVQKRNGYGARSGNGPSASEGTRTAPE